MMLTTKIKSFFTPEIKSEIDIFEKARFLISYRLTLFLTISLAILTGVLFLFFTLPHSLLTLSGFGLTFFSFLYIKTTERYKNIILVFNILGCFLCIFTLYYIKDQARIVDGFWMLINCSFTFLVLGKKWGSIITFVNTFALTMYYTLYYNEQITLIKQLNQSQINAFTINIFICFAILYYFNWQSIRTNQQAQNSLKSAHQFLEKQFDIINKQNDEKTTLLKEIHHRVKNNLQVIVSLLRLQSNELQDIKQIAKFDEAINRVITMSIIHEKIYQSEELSAVNIHEYFSSLAEHLKSSYQTDKHIELSIDTAIKQINLKHIVPLALIFNELFSNSLKHAFTEVNVPKINVIFNQKDDSKYEFIFEDNGNWKNNTDQNTFGLKLIETLAEQLNGNYQFFHTSGTKYHFNFENLNS